MRSFFSCKAKKLMNASRRASTEGGMVGLRVRRLAGKMRVEEVRGFKERADAFLDTAVYNFENGRYDLAAFNIEQAVQLYVKTRLLKLLREFPRTHSLVTLLRELSRVFKEEEVERFRKREHRNAHEVIRCLQKVAKKAPHFSGR